MRQHERLFDAKNVAVVVVSFEAPVHVQQYLRDSGMHWPVLIDERRELYRAYGMTRAPTRKIWSLGTIRAYAGLMRRGKRMRRATGDVRQRGGDVLIDPDQRIRYLHVGDTPADRPSVATLLRHAG